ncbi:MAG: hypothetical protein SGJ27_27805 [Candidatus Melainabacteria bacterium]|nr:hypothetical protein [Candidatus Melainabacteria bacterium]
MKWLMRCLYLQFRILTLTANKRELLSLDNQVFMWGLLMVWLAGLGRYWDAPLEPLFMRSGLPSLIYIWVLGSFLWMFIWLLRPANWSYMRLVTYISMTGVPAFLYAIPFERMYGTDRAAECNATVLVVVASWRVLMLANYLVRVSNLNILSITMALLLPLMTIVSVLMGLHKLTDVVSTMGGIRDRRHVVQIDEKEAIANFKEPLGSEPFDIIVGGRTIRFDRMRLHTFRGRTHVVYVQDPDDPIPPGFKVVDATDPEFTEMHPILAVTYPIEKFCEQGLMPVFWGFIVAVLYAWFGRPKEESVSKIEAVEEKIEPAEDVNNQP